MNSGWVNVSESKLFKLSTTDDVGGRVRGPVVYAEVQDATGNIRTTYFQGIFDLGEGPASYNFSLKIVDPTPGWRVYETERPIRSLPMEIQVRGRERAIEIAKALRIETFGARYTREEVEGAWRRTIIPALGEPQRETALAGIPRAQRV